MYDWYYNTLKRKYGRKCTLLYTDTNSLLVDLKTPDIYADMESMKAHYDFSDYPKDHMLYNEKNKKVIGKFKDECSGTPIAEYVGLSPKMYSILQADEHLIKSKRCQEICHQQTNHICKLQRCIFQPEIIQPRNEYTKSQKDQIYGLTINKTELSLLESKRWIAPDGMTTYAFGYRQEQ